MLFLTEERLVIHNALWDIIGVKTHGRSHDFVRLCDVTLFTVNRMPEVTMHMRQKAATVVSAS